MNLTTERIRPLFNKIHWPLLLAGIAEIPRWSVAFSAIRETWFGIPLAIMTTWAMSACSEHVFRHVRKQSRMHLLDWVVFAVLVTMLISALIIITPILYLLAGPDKTISMQNFSPNFMLFWSFSLALSTFLPLIGLAAVRASKEPEAPIVNPKKVPETKSERVVSTALVKATATQLEVWHEEDEPIEIPQETTNERKQRAWHMLFVDKLSNTEVAERLNVTTRTISNWKKDFAA